MTKNGLIRVGISIGDLNGIGSEIIFKTFDDKRIFELCTPIVFASDGVMRFFKKHYKKNININSVNNLEKVKDGQLNVFNAWTEKVNVIFGEDNEEAGKFAIKSLEASVKALKNDEIDVLVTAPINKSNIQSKTFNFPGHTDYLAQELEGDSLMFMVTNSLKVGLLTDHLPIKDIAQAITPQLIKDKAGIISKSLIKDFNVQRPKIAVLSINPHAGDNGVIGKEDDEVLVPTLNELRESGMLIYGPYSADSFFGSGNHKNFDAIIASYHDQGLIPFKTLSFGKGVNYTAGLHKVRTSPDHGTAYEIAGKDEADHNSFMEAVYTAIKIFRNREEHKTYAKNPLKQRPKKR